MKKLLAVIALLSTGFGLSRPELWDYLIAAPLWQQITAGSVSYLAIGFFTLCMAIRRCKYDYLLYDKTQSFAIMMGWPGAWMVAFIEDFGGTMSKLATKIVRRDK